MTASLFRCPSLVWPVLLAIASVCGACQGDDAVPPAPLLADGPLYAVAARLTSTDFAQTSSFVWLVSDLEAGSVKLADALEVSGSASIWGTERSGVFYVASAEQRTLSKYDISSGRPEIVGRIGLSGAGVSILSGERMVFDGPDHAFFFDLNSAQALELDLSTLRVLRSIDLSSLRDDAGGVAFLGEPGFVRFGDRYLSPVWHTSERYDRVGESTRVLFFDPKSGEFEVKDAPCGGLMYTVEAPNGDLYFSSDPYVATLHAFDPSSAPAPCLARLPAGSTEFNPSTLALNELTGAPTGGLIPGPSGTAFLRVLSSDLYRPGAAARYNEAYSVAAWETWSLPWSDPSRVERVERPPLAGGIKLFNVDGENYENESTADFGTTTLIRTTGSEASARGLSMPGVTWGIVRVR